MGEDVKTPERTIPFANVVTCTVVAVVFFITIFAIAGALPWSGNDGYVASVLRGNKSANYIMSTFSESFVGKGFAVFFSLVVIVTIFGSCFALLLGYTRIAPAAAEDGYFFESFKRKNSIALMYLRKTQPDRKRPFKVPLYPWPCIVQLIIFGFIFITTPSYFSGDIPLLELGIAFLIAGVCAYVVWG
eukprot:444269_1